VDGTPRQSSIGVLLAYAVGQFDGPLGLRRKDDDFTFGLPPVLCDGELQGSP